MATNRTQGIKQLELFPTPPYPGMRGEALIRWAVRAAGFVPIVTDRDVVVGYMDRAHNEHELWELPSHIIDILKARGIE